MFELVEEVIFSFSWENTSYEYKKNIDEDNYIRKIIR